MTLTGAIDSLVVDPLEPPLSAPLVRGLGWAEVQRMSQSREHRDHPMLHRIRATAAVRRGTRMTKILSAAQVTAHLDGWQPYGFCYRSCDIAHLNHPEELIQLRADGTAGAEIAYGLWWRAVDATDYAVPAAPEYAGLTTLPNHSRMGSLILGTGFTPSADDLIPEFITAGFADLPMPANAQLVAYPPEGTPILLYVYQAEQHGWLRMVGPRWRHLLANLPGVSPDRDYLPCRHVGSSRLVGRVKQHEYDALADPPEEFRIRALIRAARYPVETLSRRAEQATWRGVPCWVLQRDDRWARVRLVRPDCDAVDTTGARCYERGVYEAWAPCAEMVDQRVFDVPYRLSEQQSR